jgi:hypothetical protein
VSSQLDWLLEQPETTRRRIIAGLNVQERTLLLQQIEFRRQNKWLKYQGDPVGFVQRGLGETIWGKQKEILQSIIENQRTAVPACHAPGKTHIAARAVAYWAACHPPGTTKVLTTSSTFRQVKSVLWPHIRRLQHIHMPELGYTNTVEWMIGNPVEAVVEGFKPPDDDESATQGTHKANLLIVVDEAGGIKASFGRNLESLMTGGNTRMLLLGNPPVDEEQTWFERMCNSPRFNVIRIGAYDTPAWTGEETDWCSVCPIGVEPHKVVTHLVDDVWVQGIIEEFGKESAYYVARVMAQFPRDNASKTIPMSWLELARDNEREQDGPQPIRLGADIASDGGDEFVIAWAEGLKCKIVHAKAGADNEDALQVAGKIKEWILKAEQFHGLHGIQEKVRVKIDCIGVGWGVVSTLKGWQREGHFRADIIDVNVGRNASDPLRYANQRAEMWWNGRRLCQPDAAGEVALTLDIETKELAQLNGPTYGTTSSGQIQIEKKPDMKKRGVHSPDRAEAILLAVFEPPTPGTPSIPLALNQSNPWSALSNSY